MSIHMNQLDAVSDVQSVTKVKVMPYRDPVTKRFAKRPLEEVALTVEEETKLDALVAQFNASNPVSDMPVWDVESKMAVHLVYLATTVESDILVKERLPKVKGVRGEFVADKHFYASCETRQVLDDAMPADCRYVIGTFETKTPDAGTALGNQILSLKRNGYIHPVTGEKFRMLYGNWLGTGFFVMVSATSQIRSMSDLGIEIFADVKGVKRLRRIVAHHQYMCKATIIDSFSVPTGTVYVAELTNGKLISLLNFNMDLLSPSEFVRLDGTVHVNLPGFAEGCLATVSGPFGLLKGTGADNCQSNSYNIVGYGAKDEVLITGSRIYIGYLSKTGIHDVRTDNYVLVNGGFCEPQLAVRHGINAMKEVYDVLTGDDDNARNELFAGLIKAGGDDWAVVRAMTLGIGGLAFPVLFDRMFQSGFKGSVQVTEGRIPIAGAKRLYVRPIPIAIKADGAPDHDYLDPLAGDKNGHYLCCAPDLEEGWVLMTRNPNTHAKEFVLLWNTHVPALMKYRGYGWAFFGESAKDIFPSMNGADMDDNVIAIQDPLFIAKWRTMAYPVQPKMTHTHAEVSKEVTSAHAHHLGTSTKWNWKIFGNQLRQMTQKGISLGGVCNCILLDNMMSGENKDVIAKSLSGKTYIVPKEFSAPSRSSLFSMLPSWMHSLVPEDYEPTLDSFINVCMIFNNKRPDFICARVASNSEQVIDWTNMRKGVESNVLELDAESKEALKTPFFPVSFEGRMPKARQKAGDYVLVMTKLCQTHIALAEKRDTYLTAVAEIKKMIKRQLPTVLRAMYPADAGSLNIVYNLRRWWANQWMNARDANGNMRENAYKQISLGYTTSKSIINGQGVVTGTETVEVCGLTHYYHYGTTPNGVELSVTGPAYSTELRRKIAILWLSQVYAQDKEFVGDGVPDFILHDLFDAMEELGLTGITCFMQLNAYARKVITGGDSIRVDAIGGDVFHGSNHRCLSEAPDDRLPDGSYMMNRSGVIYVKEACLELQSDYVAMMTADAEAGGEEYINSLQL